MSNPFSMMKQFQTFVNSFHKMQKDPRQAVQELLDSGQMSQQQYNDLAQKASLILGRKI